MSKEWPSSIDPMSEEEWMALATSDDAKEQQQVSSALKKLGYGAREFVRWDPEQRVETIMKHQPDVESKSSSKSSSKGKKGGKRAASKRSTSKRSSSKSSSSSSSSGSSESSGSGSGLGEEGLSLLKAILEGVESIASKQDELEERLEMLEPFIKETHFGFSCIALGDDQIASNFENPDVQEDLLGVLQLEESGKEDDDEGEE